MPDKKLMDYFIEQTNERFKEIKDDLEAHRKESKEGFAKLTRYCFAAVALCIALSPLGSKVLDKFPKILEIATAFAVGH